MDVSGFLQRLEGSSGYGGQVVHRQIMPPRQARYSEPRTPLPAALETALRRLGMAGLYTHQAQAINALARGENVIVATGPASGKSLCYHLPVLASALADSSARALYLYPTKALAQDQLRSLKAFGLPVAAGIFDGDTPREARESIKRTAQVVLSNPDMLHLGILPNHRAWARLFQGLRYVVLDEAHVYRGVFGSHVANVVRRLRRLCRRYGSNPQFILCSATIANPGELAEALVGLPFTVVEEDGAPFGGKEFLVWNPPIVDQARSIRKSAGSEAADLFRRLLREGVRTMVFARTRRQVELVYVSVRQRLAEEAPDLLSRVSPYRASYLPEDRRRIEQALFSGELLGVATTNALELGIDVGSLDATVLGGYPGSISSTWQQAGRSGRRRDASLCVLIARNDPLDQYLARHPEYLFGRSPEHALIAPANPRILDSHLLCAAYEAGPLTLRDGELFGPTLQKRLEQLAAEGLMGQRRGGWFLDPGVYYPAEGVNLRSGSAGDYAVVEKATGALLEQVEEGSAFFQLHPGAVYLHYGDQFLVEELDTQAKTAYVARKDVPYYTQCRDHTDIRILHPLEQKRAGEVTAYLGEVEVSTQVVSYERKAHFTEETLGEEMVDLPPRRFNTVALWFDLPIDLVAWIRGRKMDLAGGLHAAEHAAIGVLPLFALCDRADIGGVSTAMHPDTGRPQVFIYDGHAGGIGIAEKGYELVEQLWSATLKVVEECPCEEGCPGCIHSPKCGNGNHPLDKKVAALLLRSCLGMTARE
ncbi:MAG: DEAD/DEAH box helicase [Chloroflexi bacterium]|nr:DEAD/DEAH box helicase [Chloroflexota bacterium]